MDAKVRILVVKSALGDPFLDQRFVAFAYRLRSIGVAWGHRTLREQSVLDAPLVDFLLDPSIGRVIRLGDRSARKMAIAICIVGTILRKNRKDGVLKGNRRGICRITNVDWIRQEVILYTIKGTRPTKRGC